MIRIRKLIEEQLEHYSSELIAYREMLRGYSEFEGVTLHTDERDDEHTYFFIYFYEAGKRKRKYIRRDDPRVKRIQERDYLDAYIKHLETVCQTLSQLPDKVDVMRPFEFRKHKKLAGQHPFRFKTPEELAWLAKAEEYKRQHPPIYADPKTRASRAISARTKAEALCISKLDEYGITYVYECPICINGEYWYPDFTIFINGRVFIWEHLGLFYSQDYYMKQFEKIREYASAGFYAGTNLFFTYDRPDNSIDVMSIDNLILTMINMAYA